MNSNKDQHNIGSKSPVRLNNDISHNKDNISNNSIAKDIDNDNDNDVVIEEGDTQEVRKKKTLYVIIVIMLY